MRTKEAIAKAVKTLKKRGMVKYDKVVRIYRINKNKIIMMHFLNVRMTKVETGRRNETTIIPICGYAVQNNVK